MKHNNFLTGLMSSRFSNFLSLCFLTLTLTISGNVWGEDYWSLRSDLWLDGSGWLTGDKNNAVPVFEESGTANVVTCSVVIPATQWRLTVCENAGDITEDRWNGSSTITKGNAYDTDGWDNDRKYYLGAQSDTKKWTFSYNYSTKKLTGETSDYDKILSGWKVYILDDSNNEVFSGTTDATGKVVTTNQLTGGTAYRIYIKKDGANKDIQGVTWFGGLYIDKNNSNVNWGSTQYKYYDDGSNSKFSNITWPIVAKKDAKGRFKPKSDTKIEVSFDGGKITINPYTAPTPAVYYDVTFNSNGGSSVAKQSVGEGLTVTKPADPTKQDKGFAGWYSDEQLQNKYDFSAPVTKEMTLYAKWADPFTQGETLYFFLDEGAHGWTDAGANIRALFYDINDKNKCLNTNNYEYGDDQIGNLNLGVSHFGDGGSPTTNVERIGSSYWYKVTVPYNNAGAIRFVRLSNDPHYMWCYATNKYVGDRDGYPSIRLTTNTNKDSNAEWYNETPCWTVTFDMMGHGEAIAQKQVIKGENVAKPTNPSADGWKFINWYKENTFSNVYDFNSAVNSNMTLYAKWEQLEMVTVTFDAKGGEPVPANQVIEKGTMATKPATDPAKAGYNFTGWDWNFNDAINENKTINAQYVLKGVESVTLDKTTLKLLVNGTTATLTPTILPSDVLSTTTTWSSDNESVATVENGVVTPHALGTATITCTVANTAGSKSATCTVNVVDCELVPTAIFDGKGEIANPFDPSGQSEPATITRAKIRIGNGNPQKYAYDNNGVVHANNEGDYWYIIDAGKENNIQLYYFQNATTGKYMTRGAEKYHGNEDWWIDEVITAALDQSNAKFKWYEGTDNNNPRIINRYGDKFDNNRDKEDYHLHRKNWTIDWMNYSYQGTAVACGRGANQGGDELNSIISGKESVSNPNYKTATITKDEVTYYRFATNGTMTCTLTDYALKAGDKISVYCYNTASSTVSGELRIGGSKVTDINLNAGASTYEYPVTDDSKGATQIVVATSNADFCIASVKVERELPISGGKAAGLAWTTAPADPVVATVGDGDITTYTATATSAGDITYSSSNTAVATVNAATGVVTPVAAGNAVITATIEQDGCYAGGSITYNLQVNDLPKPEITFVTLPEGALPQGLANQTIVVTTTGGDNFNLAITSGEGATLNITENTGTQITATLSMGAEATNIVLTASTDRTATLAQNAVSANVAVSACIPEGANIFEFTLTGSDAATGQVAGGIIGGTVDQTALGTVGTEDNPAMVDVITIKTRNAGGKYIGYDGGVKVVEGTGDNTKWYMIPAGRKATTSWGAGTYDLYYLYNKDAQKYLYRNNEKYVENGDWPYYTTDASADASNARATDDKYTWFVYDSGNGKLIICGDADNLDSKPEYSYHLHTANQSVAVTNGHAAKPAVPCGRTTDINDYSKIDMTATQAANPDMLKSVEYNNKTYYIISSEGQITLHGNFKAGDVVNVDTYNRKTNEDDVEEYQIQADADSYTYTTTNAYVCVNNIKVWRNQVGEMVTPTLTWDADLSQPQIVDLKNGVAPVHVATANVTTVSTITYSSSNTAVATVDGAGQVSIVGTPNHGATTTITATMAAVGCYNEASVSYTIRIKNINPTTLQTMIDGTSASGTLVLADDYDGCEATINKAITIDAQNHTIGNLTVETTGDLTLTSPMTVNDFSIHATAGNTEIPATSGQVRSADKLNVNGNAYFYYTVDPNGHVQYGWYDFTVPFPVDVRTGIKGIQDNTLKENFTNEVDYAVLEYLGQKRAQGQYSYQKFRGVMQPNQLYSITLDDEYNYNTLRFQKTAGGALVASENVELKAFSGADADANWNGVGNGTLRHADADVTSTYLQVYQSGNKSFLLVEKDNYSFVIGSAFMVQEIGTMKLSTATHDALLTPNRQAEAMKPITIQIAREGQVFTDQLFISASEDGGQQYTMGVDLAKAGDLGYATVPQLWVNAYDHPLCAYDAQMIDGQAHYLLSLYAPAAGEYTLNTKNIPEGITLYLVQNGNILWDLSQTYTLELAKGITNDYGLLLVEEHKVTTGNDNLMNDNNADKILRNGILYILHNGKTFNAQGACISK